MKISLKWLLLLLLVIVFAAVIHMKCDSCKARFENLKNYFGKNNVEE